MQWLDLLFAHWPIEAARLRPFIPAPLELDLWQGDAYLSVVPFRMENVGVIGLPVGQAFAELNVRTYVRHGDRAGVWFFSLDAASPLGVRLARRFFYLPYFDARMSITADGGSFRYLSERTHRGAPSARIDMTYSPIGPAMSAAPGSLDEWLTARYSLFSADPHGRVYRGDVMHEPWRLQPAVADWRVLEMTSLVGFSLDNSPVALTFSKHLDVRATPITRL
jgi:uncharacterized protein YqjF (DUF2071 family)